MIDGIPLENVSLLVVGTFLVSFFVSAIGPTGGLQLVAVAAALPPHLAIPMHAWITGFSALFRAWNLRGHIDWSFFAWFVAPSLGATAIAVFFAFQLDKDSLQLVIGGYIVLTTLLGVARKRAVLPHGARSPLIAGATTGFATAFIGASGPLLYAMMEPRFPTKERLMGTHSMCLTVQHASKIVLFGVLGTTIFDYPLILVMTVVASWIGTRAGTIVLVRIPERLYRTLLAIVMIAGGTHLIVGALPL